MHPRELIHPPEDWLDGVDARRTARVAFVALLGLAVYGYSVGFWRDPWMAVFEAVKLPLLVLLTLLCNGLLNGLLGMLLGTGLGFRQSWFALLSAFAICGLILGSLSPVTLMMAWNAPPPDSPQAGSAHAAYLIAHTFLIGFAGIVANIHLHRMLAVKSPTPAVATATLLAWLAGNGILGAQFSWILRPFFGTPGLEVQFLRPNPLQGNFYEAIWSRLEKVTNGFPLPVLLLLMLLLAVPISFAIQSHHPNQSKP
jgi:hypothetical protein